MADTPDATSIEDLIEDLDLHQALLQSLVETRPNAIEERDELRATIMDLQRQIARIQGVSQRSPSAGDSEPPRGAFHYEGAASYESLSPSPVPMPVPASLPQHQHSVLSHRKRSMQNSDSSSFAGSPPSKRAHFQPRELDSSSTSSRRLSSTGTDHDSDALDGVYSLPGNGVEDFQSGQHKAEKWLNQRRAQERRDEEFARRLQKRLDEELSYIPPKPSKTPQAPSTKPFGTFTIPGVVRETSNVEPAQASQAPTPYSGYLRVPTLDAASFALQRHSSQAPSPFSAHPGNRPHMQQGSSYAVDSHDSSDSDLAEISGYDFYKHHPSSGPSDYRYSSYSRNMPGAYPSSSLFPHSRTNPPSTFRTTYLSSRSKFPTDMSDQNINDMLRSLSELEGSFESGLGPRPPLSLMGDEPIDHKQTAKELHDLLENIRPDVQLAKENREGTPKELLFNLYEHQKLGLTWMKSMEEGKNKGGILADDMGLGKTVQALSLIVSRPSEDPTRKTTLIIAPVALMQQWKREIARLIKPEHKLDVFILHGEKRKTGFDKLKKYDVVITTFGTMGSELKKKEEWEEQRRYASQNGANILEKAKSLTLLGPHSTWYRVIIDEAQCIKNRNTKSAIACCALNSTYRWCMSGTPMMNNVGELHSLLKFLRIGPYNKLDMFNTHFTRPLKSGSPEQRQKALQQIRVLLAAVLLRRTKFSKLDGKPLIDLPPRVTEKVHAVFSDDERELYKGLETQTQIQFNKYLKAGTIGRNYSNILVLLLRLRQACCHPHLINDLSVDVSAVTESADFMENAKAFSADVVRRLKENESIECPVCIDAVENAVIFYPCGHATCAECFARISDPSLAVSQGVDGQGETKCPNCRAKIDPKKVTDHLSFKKVHFPEQFSGTDDQQVPVPAANEDDDDSEDDDDDGSDEDDDEGSDLDSFIVPDDDDSEHKSSHNRKSPTKKANRKGKGKGKDKEDNDSKKPKKTLAVLRKEAQRNAAAKRRYFKRLEKNWESSAKIDKAVELLEQTKNSGSGEKTIIFSQFTSLLDLLEVPIHRRGWKYRRYDGSMRPNDRNESVLEFTDNPDCDIMLVSLKAGNAGLNLVAASQVIIFDPFWNPYIEEQAIDRAHRLGQTRRVQIHRILVEKTVEDRILDLQEKKREIIEGALDEDAAKSISRLGVRELKFLFVSCCSLPFVDS